MELPHAWMVMRDIPEEEMAYGVHEIVATVDPPLCSPIA
jgi:hypothetical protein